MASTDWVEDAHEYVSMINNPRKGKFIYYKSYVERETYGKFEVCHRGYPYGAHDFVYYWVTRESVILFKFVVYCHEHVSIFSNENLLIYCQYSGDIHCYTDSYANYKGIGYLSNFINMYSCRLTALDFIVTRNYICYKKPNLYGPGTYSISIYTHDFTHIDDIIYDNARIMVNDKYIIALKLHSNTTECYLYDHDMRQIAYIIAKKNASRAKKFIVDEEKSKVVLLTGGDKNICVYLPFTL